MEIKRLHQRIGATIVYVTHDQVEAMTMATRIAIMFEGRLHQHGTPATIFDDPADLRVATFIGAPRMNILPGRLKREGAGLVAEVLGHAVPLPPALRCKDGVALPRDVSIGLRPGDIAFRPGTPLTGVIDFIEPMGSETFVTLRCQNQILVARAPGRTPMAIGEQVPLQPDAGFLYAFDTESGAALIDRSALDPVSGPDRLA